MRSSNSPPKYGAEGPPGGPEAWNRQRFGGEQSGLAGRIGGMIAGMNPQMRAAMEARQAQRQQMSQPRPWDQVARTQWPGQGGGPPQGMPPQAQGAPPPMGGQMPQQPQGVPPMQSQPTQGQAQQTGMAGLGQAAGRVAQMARAGALRRGAGRMQEQ